jgi:hypothetical protein
MTDPDTCPLCPRIRRADRPLCNNHMRKTGQVVLDRYFARARTVRNPKHGEVPGNARDRLNEVEAEMVANARRYDEIRAELLSPIWTAAGERWLHPHEHARAVLTSWHRKHQFGRDETNDRNVIDQIVRELFPPTEEGRRVR